MTTIKIEMDGAVGIVSLAKPPHNLIDDAMIADLLAAYRGVLADGARAILLKSEMRHFSAGAEMSSFTDGKTAIQHNADQFLEFLDVLENAPVPTLAAVHGAALGGGLELALTCDMIVAADTAYFGQVENIVGLIPLLGGTQRLVQRAGVVRAKEIALIGRRHAAEAFERWGIINHVVPETELQAAAMSFARQLAAGPTKVLHGIKQQANLAANGGVRSADLEQINLNNMIWQTGDRERGFASFFSTGPATAEFKGD
ncbi:enoyl-CoA hydratase/isomerase family protein [Paraburkholderia phytofirmans]|uniref:Enoyl-CoA hydratase/isomerase n=1 Tax=Paraburkholderia phytofirmans (strain DSM 17436 / LMG 22146 / PsJN) TaxID=398527 RepID=B2T5B9_PARPJ|nr:enoyl-CoA hydratase/isomerase family protein [Paraburkholderia phytofirmans]ACD16776.1 Enoyl-CoA hydratase/isomerase [Paraburkholderia phytofirmans PsJN]